MDRIAEFIEVVEHVCRRPLLYFVEGTFCEVCAYLTGYARGAGDTPLSGEGLHAFSRYVCAHFQCPDKHGWPYVIRICSTDEEAAVETLCELLVKFSEKSRTMPFEKIVKELKREMPFSEEGAPEKTMRAFSSALLRGRREEIEPLIQENAEAHLLWDGAYPEDVGAVLHEVYESFPVKVIAGSEEEGEVTILDPDFGPVSVKSVDGTWKVDAQKIIAMRKAIKDKNS